MSSAASNRSTQSSEAAACTPSRRDWADKPHCNRYCSESNPLASLAIVTVIIALLTAGGVISIGDELEQTCQSAAARK